jgi:hypothetical protein
MISKLWIKVQRPYIGQGKGGWSFKPVMFFSRILGG